MTTHKNVHDSDSPATQPIAMSGPMDGGDILRMLYSKAQGSMTRAEKTVLADSAAECSANMGLNLARAIA